MKILVPVDGSEASEHAIDALIGYLPRLREVPHVQLLYVMNPIRPASSIHGVAIDVEAIDEYYESEATRATQGAKALLTEAKIRPPDLPRN